MECDNGTDAEKTESGKKDDILDLAALRLDTDKSPISVDNNESQSEHISVDNKENKCSIDSGTVDKLCELNIKNKTESNIKNDEEEEEEEEKENKTNKCSESGDAVMEVDEVIVDISDEDSQEKSEMKNDLISENKEYIEKKEELLKIDSNKRESEIMENKERVESDDDIFIVREDCKERNDEEKNEGDREISKGKESLDVTDQEGEECVKGNIENIEDTKSTGSDKEEDECVEGDSKKMEDLDASDKEEKEDIEMKETEQKNDMEISDKAKKDESSSSETDEDDILEVDDEEKKENDLCIEKEKNEGTCIEKEKNEDIEKEKNEDIEKEKNEDIEKEKNEDIEKEKNEDIEKEKSEDIEKEKNDIEKEENEDTEKEKKEGGEDSEKDNDKVKDSNIKNSEMKEAKGVDESDDKKEGDTSSDKKEGELTKTSDATESVDDKDDEDKQSDDGKRKSQSKEGDDEDEMDVDDPDTYQINFVDVNATNIDSPMVIDDDDDDDEIVMIERKKGTDRDSSPEVVIQGETRKKTQEIVIDLDDDDDDIEIEAIKRKKKSKSNAPKGVNCCNIECASPGQELRSAPVFVLTYYGRKYKKGKAEKVCQACFEKAMEHQEHLSYVLSEHKPLLTVKFQPRNDTVVLTDSDEEGSDEEEVLPEEVLADLEEKLKEVMESTMENYDFNFQIEESKKILTHKMDELSVGFKETDDLLNELQKKMDNIRHDVYKDYAPKIRELPSLTIDDSQCGTRPPIIRLSPTRSMETIRPSTVYNRQQKYQAIQRTVTTPVNAATSPVRPRHITPTSSSSSSPSDLLRKSPIAGVATKKVTQIQRSVFPGTSNSEMRQEDVVALEQVEVTHKPLPPIGNLTRPKPLIGDVMYVMKLSFYGVWARAKVLEVVPKGTELSAGNLSLHNMYKVKFESSYRKSNPVKQVTGKQMAYTTPSPVRFPVGTRVIAIFQDNDWSKECYYSGVIAEPPKSMNKYRYLVFFDDGYAQYVSHEKILLVCECSRNVWDDIHPDSREFIRKYLEQYPERPMVKLQQGQIVKTEWNGKWWIARVVEVDGSLVKMHFDADGRTEWIYRGSTRLGPLYAELAHAAARKEQGTFSRHRGLGVATLKKRNMPYVEYTRGTDGEEMRRDDSGDGHGHSSESTPSRAVAKKSTTKRPDSISDRSHDPQYSGSSTVEKSQQPQGRVELLQLNSSRRRPKTFEPHQCGASCLTGTEYDPKAMKGENPLVIPMLCSWERQVSRCRGKRVVIYRAPCGRRLRNMEELHRYLRVTKSNMAVDLFDFDFWVHCFAEFVLERGFSNIKDLSYGAEHVPVPCVNCVDHSLPDYVSYSTKREPTDGVDLNLDPEFLTGCDCTDDCQDRDKCACWQLTIQGTAYGPGGVVDPTVGYIYRRLPEPVMTGIYECNARCKCSNTCLNRVAQQPLQLKLQVFKTENRGWGIRCLNDIPQGGFICIYAGRLLTEQGANEGGKNYGDEYLAELDYIEVVEKLKEGYESDVVEDDSDSPSEEKGSCEVRRSRVIEQTDSGLSEEEEEEGETSQEARDSDEDFTLPAWDKEKGTSMPEQCSIRTRLRNRASRHGSEDSQHEHRYRDRDRDRDGDSGRERDREGEKESERGYNDEKSRRKAPRSVSSSDHNYSDDEDNEQLRLPSRFAAVSEPKESDKNKKPKTRSVREFFGNDEYCYIMDAKNNGNIGRYLNHSCSPNVFVQNVFVDTHDLRFPWVAFFALTYIHGGTELTWDYNYDVGSVPGKALHCYCGSNDCRGRLL